ncbi:protein SEY1 [Cantharellus anzutake]|uniref:protein SEY1 n=1 Tax=Cantharellus anzutake TaxID=1750568 RepID=UPI0019052FD6|nr:protein SEY1 [Cantharellus anzutake]KAF8331879.1 protein SEY1 [Cantharellus anzutake]
MQTLPVQVINEEKEFTPHMSKFLSDWDLADAGFNYNIVAVFGSQSTGKSTLLNRLFGTTFEVMNESERRQTTKGIWACRGKGMSVMVMDVEGTDGRERGEDQDFERKSALFSLASSEVLIVNIWEHQVGLYQGANMGLLKTVFEVNLSIFGSRNTLDAATQKTLLLFVIRDHVGSTPLANLAQTLTADLNKIWDSLSKPAELSSRRLTDYFDLSFTGLPHKLLMPEKFEREVVELRKRFTDRNREDFIFKPAYHKRIPADGVARYMEGIWEQVQSNKDLDLPTQQELLAQFRCDEIAAVALEQFNIQSKSVRRPIESGKVQEELGKSMGSWKDGALARFDRDASRYHAGVYKRKRADLVAQIHANLSPLFFGQIKNLHKHAVVSFKKAVLDGLKGDSYDFASVVKGARATWEGAFTDGAKEALLADTDWSFEEELASLVEEITHIADQCRADETKKMVNQIERNLRNQISEPIELALNRPSPTMWDSVLLVLRDALDKASNVYHKKAQSFNCTEEENTSSLNILRRRGWSGLRSKVDEQTTDASILGKLRSSFEEKFRYDENGVPRVWKPEDDINAAFRKARDQTLELVPLYSRIQPQDPSLEFSLPPDADEASLSMNGEPVFDFPSTLVVFTESKQLDITTKFKRDADAYYVEAKRSVVSSVAQVPIWIYILLVVLGWNEAMAVLFNPVYFAVLLSALGSVWIIIKLNLVGPLYAVTTAVTTEIQRQATAKLRAHFAQPQLGAPIVAQNHTSSHTHKQSESEEFELNTQPELSPM